jgi:hypothetical protein
MLWAGGVAAVAVVALAVALVISPRDGKPRESPAVTIPPLADLRMGEIGEQTGNLGPLVRDVVDADGRVPQGLRMAAVGKLPPELSVSEQDALLAVLEHPRGTNETAGRHSEFFHELALKLGGIDALRERFARVLATVARDDQQDGVVRDYALQHLRQVWERSDDPLRKSIEATFSQISSTGSELSASALLSLHLLGTGDRRTAISQSEPAGARTWEVPSEKLDPVVKGILARQPTARGIPDRMTALRIAGDRRLADRRDDLKRIAAARGGEHRLVRMAAIAAIARFADPADIPFFKSVGKSDPEVASAVTLALVRLQTTPQ